MYSKKDTIWRRLTDSWDEIISNLPLQFIPFIGVVFGLVIFINQIGNAIKINELKREMPEHPELKQIFIKYLIGILAPFVGPIFWSKGINILMELVSSKATNQSDIEYVKKKGKIFGILGLIAWIIYYPAYSFYYYGIRLPAEKGVTFTHESVIFLIILFSFVALIILVLCIFIIVFQVRILKRLVYSIKMKAPGRIIPSVNDEQIKVDFQDEVEFWIKSLEGPDKKFKEEAIISLGEIGDKRALPHLKKLLMDKSKSIRELAKKAIKMIEDESRDLEN